MNDENVGGKLDAEDKKTIEAKVEEVITWLDGNQTAEVDEFEDKLKEIEGVATRSSPRCTAKLAARRRRVRTLAVPKVELKVPVALPRARRSKKSIKKKVRERREEKF